MALQEISHKDIEKVVSGVKVGMINPIVMVYIFEALDGRFMGVNAESYEEAEGYIKAKSFHFKRFVKCEPITYYGFTVTEILAEANRRGIK